MKRLFTVIAFTLAANFLLVVGGVVYLYKSGRLTEDKIRSIRELVLHPATQPSAATQPTAAGAPGSTAGLDQLLAKVAGRPAGEQVEFMQRTFDAHSAILDRKVQELERLKVTIASAQKQLDDDRRSLATDRAQLASQQEQQAKLATDQGFQDTLNLYTTMPAKQVKTIFMTLDDDTMINYLRAMEPRTASKITKEFKSNDEMTKVGRVLEKMRQAAATTQPTAPATASTRE
ncbi:MAG: hypothetical protein ACAI43_00120 [Phycisphaerae bacterium]|nr:hypothetical protein [Tepidisphaeraceae bacterium]